MQIYFFGDNSQRRDQGEGAGTICFMRFDTILIQDFKKGAAKEKKLKIEAETQLCKGLRTNGQISIYKVGKISQGLVSGIFPAECRKLLGKVFQEALFINGLYKWYNRVL